MPRVIQPELLDSLPPDDPDAQHSRRDLRRINTLMGNHRWLARVLPALLEPGERALELGAGSGELGMRLHRAGIAVDGLDLCPAPPHWPRERPWHRADLRSFGGYGDYAVVFGGLIFHHLCDAELRALGAAFPAGVRTVVAAEPARSGHAQRLFRWFAPLFGANRVTMHDADVSIAAGFQGLELPGALGLTPPTWHVQIEAGFPGGYRMVARRCP